MAKKIGIVLCGGGVRGLCQIGVLHTLEKHGIIPGYISGASIGAIIGVFYAAGVSPLEMLEISKESTMIRIFNPRNGFHGISNLKYLEMLLEKHIPARRFEKLKKKLFVAATNLNLGRLEIFDKGELYKPVMASASVPGIFQPQLINGYHYVDAAIFNNVPVEPVRPLVDILIACYVHSHGEIKNPESLTTWKGVLDRALSLSLWEKSKSRLEQCDVVIEPHQIYEYSVFNKKEDERLFEIGAEETEKIIPQLKEAADIV